jgi:anti-sigma factor ChrR (cupin superfamily)
MTTEQQQEQASLYVLGALSAEEQRGFEAELRASAELRELVRALQRTAGLLATAGPQTALPPALKQKVLARIEGKDRETSKVKSSGAPPIASLPGFLFHGAADPKGWKELPLRGAWIKMLALDRDRRYAVLLGKLEAGVRYPAHEHLGSEQIYLLTGDLHIGDRTLRSGDFHHADAGTAHGVNYSVEGCTLLAVLPAEHELVQFAMAGS